MIEYGFQTDQLYSASFGVRVIDSYPVIQYGSPSYTQKSIPGRRGTLTESDGTYSDTIISMDCDITLIDEVSVDLQYQRFITLLMQSKKLILEGMETRYFQIKKVEVSDYERYSDISIEFSLTFTCDPGVYLLSGDFFESVSNNQIINIYSMCEPVYRIEGTGSCTLTINDKELKCNVDGTIYIDTEKQEVVLESGQLSNTLVTGDFDDLYLKTGINSVSITPGFALKVKPRWRWLHP
jgi:phage-related protein